MPWHVEKRGARWAVVKEGGEVVATHPSKKRAQQQVKALYANADEDNY